MAAASAVPELRWKMGQHWRLEGKRLVVTGSTKGIGLHAAREALNLGCECVLLVSRSADDLARVREQLLRELGAAESAVATHACDVATEAGRASLVARATELWAGAADALVNNVGTNIRKKIGDVSAAEYESMLSTNCASCFFLCQAFQPLLEKGRSPCVVNVASVAGVTSSGTGAPYAMSKAAMVQLTRSLACEWGPLGIRVNCVAPWMTMTPLLAEAVAKDPTQLDAVAARTPLGRIATPEEIACAIAFMLLPAASYVTGQTLTVDGGITANGFAGPCAPPPAGASRVTPLG